MDKATDGNARSGGGRASVEVKVESEPSAQPHNAAVTTKHSTVLATRIPRINVVKGCPAAASRRAQPLMASSARRLPRWASPALEGFRYHYSPYGCLASMTSIIFASSIPASSCTGTTVPLSKS